MTSFFKIDVCLTSGKREWHTFPMVVGETIDWTATEPGSIDNFAVLIDQFSAAPAMACIAYRNGKRLTMKPLKTMRTPKHLAAIFVCRDADDHQVGPGDTFRIRFEAVTDLDFATSAKCEFCGGETIRVAGEDAHDEPPCDPWLERDRRRWEKSWN